MTIGHEPICRHSKTRTLVIGGGGYIGFHLVGILAATGRKVTILGRSSISKEQFPVNAEYLQGDFGDIGLIRSLLCTHDEVIHLAYATLPNTSFNNPLGDLLQNLPSTVLLFSEIATSQARLIFVSSGGTIYGEAKNIPISEDHPTNPISPYGLTKLTLEKYAQLYAVTHGLKVIIVRPSNAYGPGQRPHQGQGFIATAMASILKRKAVKIFGEIGTVRDYIYVSDIANGIVRALEAGHLSEIYNIGSGIGLSNLEVLAAMSPIMKEVECEIHIEHLPERIFDVQKNILNARKLHQHTGWKPMIDLNDGLALTRDWIKVSHG